MLLRRTVALNPEFAAEFSQCGAATLSPSSQKVDHHCRICPTCGDGLQNFRCKLVCAQCGFYLSCADFY